MVSAYRRWPAAWRGTRCRARPMLAAIAARRSCSSASWSSCDRSATCRCRFVGGKPWVITSLPCGVPWAPTSSTEGPATVPTLMTSERAVGSLGGLSEVPVGTSRRGLPLPLGSSAGKALRETLRRRHTKVADAGGWGRFAAVSASSSLTSPARPSSRIVLSSPQAVSARDIHH